MTSWFVVQKLYSKMHLISCTNTHHDVTDLVNHGMVKNTKTWISWERNIIFLQNKKILNLCFGWHILRSYHFVAEVTFKLSNKQVYLWLYTWTVMYHILSKNTWQFLKNSLITCLLLRDHYKTFSNVYLFDYKVLTVVTEHNRYNLLRMWTTV